MTVKIAIAGAAGRMGQALLRAAGDGFAVTGGSERAGSPAIGQVLGAGVVSESVAQAISDADVWIDFTAPQPTVDALEHLKAAQAAVIGTTGLTPEQEDAVAKHAKRIAIVRDRNFSLGVNLLVGLVEQAAARLREGWDIEITEGHHRRKVDAPSGTALMIGDAAAKGRGAKLSDLRTAPYDGQTGPRRNGSIGFSVIRGGGIIGDHEAAFISDEEILSINHRALDRAIFAKGALVAAGWAAGRAPGLYTMRDVLDL